MGSGALAAFQSSPQQTIRDVPKDELTGHMKDYAPEDLQKVIEAAQAALEAKGKDKGEDTGTPSSDGFRKMPEDPQMWGMTTQQLYDYGVEVFGSPEEMFKAGMEVFFFGRATFEKAPYSMEDSETMSNLASMSMRDVVKKHMKPKTKEARLSLSVFLNSEPKKATVFVSHSWKEKFSFFCMLLCFDLFPDKAKINFLNGEPFPAQAIPHVKKDQGVDKTAMNPDLVLWICASCINQHADIAGELGSDVLDSPFAKVLEKSNEVRIIYNPEVNLYSRVWCVLEGYLAAKKLEKKEKNFEVNYIGMPARAEAQSFLKSIGGADSDKAMSFKHLLGHGTEQRGKDEEAARKIYKPFIQEYLKAEPTLVENASASVESDREKIMAYVNPSKDAVNEFVYKMREDMLDKAMSHLMIG